MNTVPTWTLGRTMISQALPGGSGQATSVGMNTALGSGNYNAVFVSLRTNNYHGLTAVSNFTWGRSLGTSQLAQYNSASTPEDIFNLHDTYGSQNFDYKFLYNLSMYYQPPVFRGQKGVLGHILGGWTFSPLFTAQSGGGTAVGYSEGSGSATQGFGEVSTGSGTTSTSEDAVGFSPYTGNIHANYNIYGGTGTNIWQGTQSVGTKTAGTYGLNAFTNPAQVYSEFRPCVLGFDTSCGGYYNLRGLPDLERRMSRSQGYRHLQGTCGRHAVHPDHQCAESLPAERTEPQPDRSDDVWPDHRPIELAEEYGVRSSHPVLT